jgi:citrate lyase subunit beta/citryl-CoA lyase
VPAVDTVYSNSRDAAGLARAAIAARRDGFSGMLAIHPAQIAVIHDAFPQITSEIDRAQQIVERFADAPQSGTVSLDGVMLDRPHLLQAQRTLELAERARGR